jgi:hypothetical protein
VDALLFGRLVALGLAALLVGGCLSSEPRQVDPNQMTAPMTADQIAREIEQAKARTPMPIGARWMPIALDPTGVYGVYGGASMVEFQAACAWFSEAIAADAASDEARFDAATAVIVTIPSWRTFADPALSDATLRSNIGSLVRSAASKSFENVDRFLAANCRG